MQGQPSREEMEDEQNAESSYPIVYNKKTIQKALNSDLKKQISSTGRGFRLPL